MAEPNTLYVWKDGRWIATGGGASDSHIVSVAEPPPGTEVGDLWIDPDGDAAGTVAGDSTITVHADEIPQPADETPQGIEDAFALLPVGLHYYTNAGTLVALTRQPYQTTITLTGPVSSYTKIVKSEVGLPTAGNPSILVLKTSEGQWIKMSSDELGKPFSNQQRVDIFALNGGGDPATTDLSGYYTKTESDSRFLNYQYFNDNAYYGPSVTFKDTFGTVRWKTTNYGTGPDAILAIAGWGDPNVPNSPVVPRLYFEATDEIGGYLAYSDDHYTKAEVDAAFPNYQYLSEITDSLNSSASFYVSNASAQLDAKIQLKADKADTYTKPEVDEAIAASISGQLSPAQIEELVSQVGPVDLTDYAKREDNTQNLIASAFVGQGFVFGSEVVGSNPGLVYTDTNEGYGNRLVLGTPAGKEYLVYASDLDPVKTRVATLEGRAATATPANINDPSLADFKASVMDEVKKMMAGGKAVPADVAWTKLLNAGTAVNAPEAKVLNGIVYMRGEAVKQGGAGYTANAYQLPPTIPAPPREMVVPLAMKNTTPSGRYYGYATIQTNRQIGVSCDNSFNTVWFDGISYPAYE